MVKFWPRLNVCRWSNFDQGQMLTKTECVCRWSNFDQDWMCVNGHIGGIQYVYCRFVLHWHKTPMSAPVLASSGTHAIVSYCSNIAQSSNMFGVQAKFEWGNNTFYLLSEAINYCNRLCMSSHDWMHVCMMCVKYAVSTGALLTCWNCPLILFVFTQRVELLVATDSQCTHYSWWTASSLVSPFPCCPHSQFLPLPELMPFRLTPQIINLLRPLSESGQLRSCMVHSMRALRTSPLLLLNTMEVFIKEPSLDWKVCAVYI